MTPTFLGLYAVHLCLMDTVPCSDIALAIGRLTDFDDLLFRQFLHSMIEAAARILFSASFGVTVDIVVGHRPNKQMVWVYAVWIVASMANAMTAWDRAIESFKR